MLQHIVEFATKTIQDMQPGFGPKRVKWRIDINQNGKSIIQPYGDSRIGGELEKCPEYPANLLQGGGKCHFLVETLQVMLLLLDKKDDPENLQSKNKYFINLLKMAATKTPELLRAIDYFNDENEIKLVRGHLCELGAKPLDKAFFVIDGMNPLEQPSCMQWWAEFRSSLLSKESDASSMLCYLRGNNVTPEATHPKISGLKVVGGRGQDILIGFDKDAYQSFHLQQSENCAMSENAVNQYSKGLDFLISNNSRMLAGSKVVHWFKETVAQENDPLAFLFEPPEITEAAAQGSARQILESLRTGQRPTPTNNRYYAITLSGASGRVMLRDWMEGSFEDLVTNVTTWFDDIAMTNRSGRQVANAPTIEQVVTCLLQPKKPKQKYEDWVRPVGHTRLVLLHSGIQNIIIPFNLIARLAAQLPAFFMSKELNQVLFGNLADAENVGMYLSLLYTRMGLIKAYFIRKGGNHNMSVYLNKEHPEPAYHCGRLLATLASLQYAALGDVGAGVIQRYYAAASQTPGLTFGRIIANAQNHLNKLDRSGYEAFQEQLAEVSTKLKDRIPKTLDLEGQTLFALGYYQQIAANRAGEK